MIASAQDDALVASATDVGSGCLQTKEEACTCSLHVETESVVQSACTYYKGGSRGEMVIGCGGGTQNHIHAHRIRSGLAQELLYGTYHHVACAGALFGFEDMACLHADAFHNPLIAGIHDGRHFLIVQDVVGYIASHTGNYSIYLFHLKN